MITNYERLLQLDAEERQELISTIEMTISEEKDNEEVDTHRIEILEAFLKFLEEMPEVY